MARVKISYWEKWGGEEWEAMVNIVHSFNNTQDDYEVVMMPAGDWSSSPDLTLFLRAQQQGNPPDLIGLENHQIVDLAAQKALISLNGFIEPIESSQVGYHEQFLALGEHEDQLYGVPISANIATLYLNLECVQGTRFEGGRIPPDFCEFEAALEEIRVKGEIGFVPTYPGWWPHVWAWFFGGSWFDDNGRFTPNHPGNVRAYNWISSLRHRWDVKEFTKLINPIGARDPDPFLTSKVAMVFEGDWLVRRLLHFPDLEWTPAAFPTANRRPAALIVADMLCIPKGAQHPGGAAEFIRFAMQPEHIERLALDHGKISPIKHWSEKFLETHRNPKLRELQKILLSAQLFHDPRIPGWMNYVERIKAAFKRIWSGQQSAAQALAAIQ